MSSGPPAHASSRTPRHETSIDGPNPRPLQACWRHESNRCIASGGANLLATNGVGKTKLLQATLKTREARSPTRLSVPYGPPHACPKGES